MYAVDLAKLKELDLVLPTPEKFTEKRVLCVSNKGHLFWASTNKVRPYNMIIKSGQREAQDPLRLLSLEKTYKPDQLKACERRFGPVKAKWCKDYDLRDAREEQILIEEEKLSEETAENETNTRRQDAWFVFFLKRYILLHKVYQLPEQVKTRSSVSRKIFIHGFNHRPVIHTAGYYYFKKALPVSAHTGELMYYFKEKGIVKSGDDLTFYSRDYSYVTTEMLRD